MVLMVGSGLRAIGGGTIRCPKGFVIRMPVLFSNNLSSCDEWPNPQHLSRNPGRELRIGDFPVELPVR